MIEVGNVLVHEDLINNDLYATYQNVRVFVA